MSVIFFFVFLVDELRNVMEIVRIFGTAEDQTDHSNEWEFQLDYESIAKKGHGICGYSKRQEKVQTTCQSKGLQVEERKIIEGLATSCRLL